MTPEQIRQYAVQLAENAIVRTAGGHHVAYRAGMAATNPHLTEKDAIAVSNELLRIADEVTQRG